ncbi:glycosyltransferase [Pseudomonas soli]|uniref:glycosyltransferase n=1 Tax=Pseudomonas soli TaxID=1306993 RepID=UPI0003C77F02
MKFSDFSSDLVITRDERAPQAPRVTVILPTYCRGHGPLQEAIDSVLGQTYDDFELIIIDDGSRDGTALVLEAYAQQDSRVIVHSYHGNSGLPALRVDQAALHAKGHYIAYQFDDDIWPEDSLRCRMAVIEQQPGLAVVYGTAQLDLNQADGSVVTRLLGRPFNYGLLMGGNYIANNSVLHHRALFDVAGMYDPHISLRRHSDYDLWLRFAKHADFIWVDEVVSHVRANMAHSLGRDVPMFFTQYRKCLSIKRDSLLLPSTICNYDVLDISQFAHAYTARERDTYRRTELVPFLTKFNDYCSTAELAVIAAMRATPLHLLTVKPDYSTSVDVTIGNFVDLPHQRAITSTFVREGDLPSFDTSTIDIAILYRTVLTPSRDLAQLQGRKLPVTYLMDDNMLRFHEVGAEHGYLAPGTPTYQCLAQQIRAADACIGYSEEIVEDFKELNPRSLRLDTNIAARHVTPRLYDRGDKLRIAVLSGPVRKEILEQLWEALTRFATANTDTVEFHFWGIDPAEYAPLDCPVFHKPFTHVYDGYLRNLGETSFDAVLVPLDFSTRAARSKSPVKLLEALAAGAVCIFTDAPPYQALPDGCCLKVANTTDAWEQALVQVMTMGAQGREAMLEKARKLVLARYTTEAQFYDFVGSFEAVRLHAKLGSKAILYAFHEPALGGATLHLIRHAGLVASLGFRVVGIVPASERYVPAFRERWDAATRGAALIEERWPSGYAVGAPSHRPFEAMDEIAAQRLVEQCRPRGIGLLHFATWAPTMSLLATELHIPCVASVHQFHDGAGGSAVRFADAVHCSSLAHGWRWADTSKSPVRRIVCPVDEAYFDSYDANRTRAHQARGPLRILVSGTLQPRKNQLAAIKAAILLKKKGHNVVVDLIGYDEFFKGYVGECKDLVRDNAMEEQVIFHGFIDDPKPFYDKADLLLISATDESMPQTMLQAMAAGIPVVSTNVGGVSEVIKHRYSGFLTLDDTPEAMASAIAEYLALPLTARQEIIERGQRAMCLLAHPRYVRYELMDLYLQAFGEFEHHKQRPLVQDEIHQVLARERILLETVAKTRGQLHSLMMRVELEHGS